MSRGRPSLAEAAARALEEGPLPPSEIARRVLRLSGPAEGAASVVRALLGTDPRFREDEQGLWRLAGPRAFPGPALRDVPFAVVDLETTGSGFRRGHRVTEIAIVEVRDGAVRTSYERLVNPGRSIPDRVRGLTGITDRMVAAAPYFDTLADDVAGRLRDRVFVAHNVRFDWGFLREELAQATGDVPDVRALCTVRLSRALLPRLKRYRLDAVADHFGIPVHPRHRALGDALATARILLRLLDEASLQGIVDLDGLIGVVEGGARPRPEGRASNGEREAR